MSAIFDLNFVFRLNVFDFFFRLFFRKFLKFFSLFQIVFYITFFMFSLYKTFFSQKKNQKEMKVIREKKNEIYSKVILMYKLPLLPYLSIKPFCANGLYCC